MVRLSIITVAYNASRTINDCLDSVKNQTFAAEHIVIDGKSGDGTMTIVESYRPHLGAVISEADSGIYDAMNKGVLLATGDVVGILNADDFYVDDEVLGEVAKTFEDPRIDACFGDLQYVDAKTPQKIIRQWKAGSYNPAKFYWGWMPPHPTFFVRSTVYEKYGLFNLDLGSAADYEIMLRFLLKHKINAVYLPRVLVKMRTGGASNATFKNRLRANIMDRKAWVINRLNPHPWTLVLKPIRKVPQYLLRP